MKKVYFLGLALMVGGLSANAQRTSDSYTFGNRVIGNELDRMDGRRAIPQSNNGSDRALNVLWTEDFTGGMTTSNGTYTLDAGMSESSYWTIQSTVHPLDAFNWTHAMTDEHMRWDSYNPNGSETAFATTVVNGAINTPSIDLSGSATSSAILEFDVETMFCCNFQEFPWFVYVSLDGGTSFGTAIPLDFGVDRNVPTEDIAHPLTFSVDLSSELDPTPANNANVVIKFAWEATNADGNGQINTHYFWMLDDMVIFEVPPYEVQHQRLWLGDIQLDWEYGDIDNSQEGVLTVQSKVKSIGSGVPTNYAHEITVFDASMTSVYTETGGTLSQGLGQGVVDTITFITALDLSTLANGTYTLRSVAQYDETDEVPTNDTLWRTFNLTDNFLSHVDYDQPTGRNFSADDSRTETGANFPIYNTVSLQGVDFYIRDGSTTNPSSTGIEIEVLLYENGASSIDYVAGPFTFDLTAGMIGQWNTFNLHQAKYESYSPIQLDAGKTYIPVINVQSGDIVWYQNNGIDEDNSGLFYHDGDGTWYSTGDEPWIAMNFDVSLGLESTNAYDFSIGQNVPNPFGDNSIISYTLENSTNVSINFTDVSGKIVKSINQGTQAAGTYNVAIEAGEFAEGVYFYTFTVGSKQITKRMVVTK